jgi:hypothetical protein
LVLEGVVVVLSILIAFALDAWWDGRQAASELNRELTNVLSEVRAKRTDAFAQIREFERAVDGATALLEVMDEDPESAFVVVPDTVAYLANRLPTLNPRLSALDALITSGLLASIEDPALRSALGRLKGDVEDAIAEIERIRSVFFSVHEPELSRQGFDNAPLIHLVEVGGQLQPSDPLPMETLVQYPNRLIVRNQTRTRRVVVKGTIRRFRALAEDLAAIEALLADYVVARVSR